MQRGTTILQRLIFRPDSSFSDPATLDGKIWNSALKQITQSQGWSQLHWGPHLASKDVVDLLITWTSHANLQHFIAHNYRSFLAAIEPLLLLESSLSPSSSSLSSSASIRPPNPYVMQLHPGMPSLELGAVSALHELSFNAAPDADLKTELAIETQLCRNLFFDAAQGIGGGELFLGMDAIWMERYDPIPSPTPAATDAAVEIKPDGSPKPEILLVITEWATPDAEKTVLESGQVQDSHTNQVLTTGEYFAKNLLQKASAYTKDRVVFENVSAANVQWLGREEKWSTYVARLLAEEDGRRKNA